MSQRRRLAILLALNAALVGVLLVVGLAAGSLGVLAAGWDYLADASAIGLGLLAVRARQRGHERAPALIAGLNATVLLVGSALVLVAGVGRLVHGSPQVHGLPVLVVSAVATVVMVVGVLVLGTDAGDEDLHLRSVLLDTAADALASAAVAVSGLVIWLTGRWAWLDAALSVVLSLLVGAAAIALLRQVVLSLRTGHPLELDD